MKSTFMTLALFGLGVALVPGAQAQNKASEKSPVTVTGCLAQGDAANEYSIKDSSGKTYGLTSTKVQLKPHLGHQVSITGTPYKENEAAEKHEDKSAKAEESEHLRVTELKMIATTCQ